ncbi:MAG: hypothetical protein NTZ78_00115 [Candidatus Aureabacteria bacterium]|nr:hypothetical protein [Candidatus Auribacterota bacterium]
MSFPRGFIGMGTLVLIASVFMIAGSANCFAEWRLIYSENWNDGASGWSAAQSMSETKIPPDRIYLGHSMAEYALLFSGSRAWAIRGRSIPEKPVKISTTAVVYSGNRNALSVNVRNAGGQPIYKYGFCSGVIGANKQPPTWSYRDTDLSYEEMVPYELYSIWVPRRSCFALGLKNLLTGQDRLSNYIWSCRNGYVPASIDFDQEGGQGPVVLLRIDVYMWM